MILSTHVKIYKSNRIIKYYEDKGYIFTTNIINVEIKDLPLNSHKLIKVKCDKCGKIKDLSYSKYNKNTKNSTLEYCCSQICNNSKKVNTFLKKYGTTNPSKLDIIKDKQEKTNIKKYGSKSALTNLEIREKSVNTIRRLYNKNYKVEISKKEFTLYRNKVISETRKHKKLLFNDWNGYDYYDNEYIIIYKNFKHTHRFYPTIDHKISILYGFNNKMSPELIGAYENLCITKRYINSSKGYKNDYKI
jgi:bifunctional DNA-binding transcriptional regulator/antitoxin component of YhaV-PrlF toxin-antitoxin module